MPIGAEKPLSALKQIEVIFMGKRKKSKFKCKSEAQKRAIAANYARKAAQKKRSASPPQQSKPQSQSATTPKKEFPDKFPFWARLKIGKNRTALVIDEEPVVDKRTEKTVDGFVHREATHSYNKRFTEVNPNPDKFDKRPMYLKRPDVKPKILFKPHNKELDMPDWLIKMYDKNNHKGNDGDDKKE